MYILVPTFSLTHFYKKILFAGKNIVHLGFVKIEKQNNLTINAKKWLTENAKNIFKNV